MIDPFSKGTSGKQVTAVDKGRLLKKTTSRLLSGAQRSEIYVSEGTSLANVDTNFRKQTRRLNGFTSY